MTKFKAFRDLYLYETPIFWEDKYDLNDFKEYSKIATQCNMKSFEATSMYGMNFYNDLSVDKHNPISLLGNTEMDTIWMNERKDNMIDFDEKFSSYNLKFEVIKYDLIEEKYVENAQCSTAYNIKDIWDDYYKFRTENWDDNHPYIRYMIFPTNREAFAFLFSKALYDILRYQGLYEFLQEYTFKKLKLKYYGDDKYYILDEIDERVLYVYTTFAKEHHKLSGFSKIDFKFNEVKNDGVLLRGKDSLLSRAFKEKINSQQKEETTNKTVDEAKKLRENKKKKLFNLILLSQMFNNNK